MFNPSDSVYDSSLRFITGDSFSTRHCFLYNKVAQPSCSVKRDQLWFLFLYKALIGSHRTSVTSYCRVAEPAALTRKTVYCLCWVPRVSTDHQTAAFKHCAPHTRNILHTLLKYDSLKSLEHVQSRIITLGNFSCTCFKWHRCVCDGMLVCVFLSLNPQRVSPRSK